jgi:hypothetical protein
MNMDLERHVVEFEIDYEEFQDFMKRQRPFLISEIVTAGEEMLYNNLDSTILCRVKISRDGKRMNMDCKIKLTDFISDIDVLLGWVVEKEEYELAHRVKLLKEYLTQNEMI